MAREIEFVCCNPDFPDATDPAAQERLMSALRTVPGLHVYRQDFGDGQTSLAAILKDDAPKHLSRTISRLANRHGVSVDMENSVSDSFVDSVVKGELEGQTHYYGT